MGVAKVKSNWSKSSGNLTFFEEVLGNGASVRFGYDDQGLDVHFFGATSGSYAFWDEANNALKLVGSDVIFADNDQAIFGTGSDFALDYDGSDLALTPATTGDGFLIGTAAKTVSITHHGTYTIGVDDTGYDFKLFGATAGAHLLWDESDNALEFVGAATLEMGVSATPLVYTEGVPIVDLYATCASTDGGTSAQPFMMKSTMTGAGGVGGRALFHLYTNVVLGGWSNALKGYAEYGATGGTTGLGSAIVGELALSAGTSSGTYAALEAELVLGAGASTGTETSFLYMAASGAAVATMDTAGDLFKLDGLTMASGKLFQANTAAAATHALRIDIGGTKYYVMLTDTGA